MQVEPTKVRPAIRQDYARVGDLRFPNAESGAENDRLVFRIPDSAHWVQNEAIAEVNQALLEFLSDHT